MTVFTATRRTRAFFTAAVTGVLVLTGCSTDDCRGHGAHRQRSAGGGGCDAIPADPDDPVGRHRPRGTARADRRHRPRRIDQRTAGGPRRGTGDRAVHHLSNAAEEFIAEQEGFYADFRAQHPEFAGKTATFALYYYGGGYGLAYSSWAGSDVEQLFLDLGFAANPIAAEFVEDDAVSNELIGKLDADVLILVDNSEGHIDEITSQPLFQNIPAVRDGRWALVENLSQQRSAYVHDGVEHEGNLPWALSGSNPLAARWASEQLVPIVAATVQ